MAEAFICDAVRNAGRSLWGAVWATLRTDDLAKPARFGPWSSVIRVSPGNRSMMSSMVAPIRPVKTTAMWARMAVLLAGLPVDVPGTTLNRLCGSGLDAIAQAARAIRAREADLMIAGGVESMSRAPFVMGKAASAFQRSLEVFDTTIGWRFVNPKMKAAYGIDSMPETAENVAAEFAISRSDQDAFAWRSQQRWAAADAAGRFADEILAVEIAQQKGEPKRFVRDEHARPEVTLEALAGTEGGWSRVAGRSLPVMRPG
jgi:acetyl-CoA acyltransferase